MRFSTHSDMEIPIEQAFARLADFDAIERMALRRGADVTRLAAAGLVTAGTTWDTRLVLRGRKRRVMTKLIEFARPNLMQFEARSGAFEADFRVEFMALSRTRTRVGVTLDVRARTLTARLMMQSARLAKNRLNRRFKKRVAAYLLDMEKRHWRVTGGN